jgi:DNA-binding SARP family transcriptional activator/DNA-binding transcriptional ArsR family regulator
MDQLRIHLFGGFLLERGGLALPPIASRAGRSLFAYLVMQPDRPIQRDLLAGTFWPDLPESRARRRLSHTLWQIQDVVNTPTISHLDVTTDTLTFKASTSYWLDVEEFDRSFSASPADRQDKLRFESLEASRLRECVELYRGDFLAGYFDDWVLVEQDHYRQRYLSALRRLVDATKANGAYEEALAFARRLTHHDQLNEEAYREVMRLSFLLGRTNEAIEQYERCKSVLEEELGTSPSPSTVEIFEKIMRQRRAGIRPLGEEERTVLQGRRSDAPFVGREDERRVLVDCLERVLAGSGGVVLVEGEPGVGKTRLTIEAAEDARWRGFEVSWGSCRPGAIRPFAPLIEVLESLSPLRIEQLSEQVESIWLGEAAKIAPSLGRRVDGERSAALRPAEASTRMIEALVHTLEALGKIAPHVVIIDDVHWADQDTLSVLTQIGTRLAGSRVLLLLLYRSEEARGDIDVWDVMRDLDRVAGLGRVVLSPLSVFELEEMVRRILGVSRLDAGVAARLHRQTGGNVLFAIETLLALRDQGLFESGVDPASVLVDHTGSQSLPVAPRVRSVIESRLALLGDHVSKTYELAALCADVVDVQVIESAADLPRSEVLDALDELLYRGLLRDDGSGNFRIAHDQVAQVVYESIEPERRRELHQSVAEALTRSDPGSVEAIGHHFREGGDLARATQFLRMAGLRAIELNAYATARHHFRSAAMSAESVELSPGDRYELLGHLEDVLNVLGRRGEQEDVIGEMSDLIPSLPDMAGDMLRRRAWLQAQQGELVEAERSARSSVDMEKELGDDAGFASSLVALGTVLRWSGRPLEAIPVLEDATMAAVDLPHRADALTELASTLAEIQQADAALARLEEAEQIYHTSDDLRGQAEVSGIRARIQRFNGQSDLAFTTYGTAIDLCRQIGYRHGEGLNLTNLANLQQLQGGVVEAMKDYDRAARIFDELGNIRGEAMVLTNSASGRHHLLGDDERARSDALRAMDLFSRIGDRAREAQCQETLAGIMSRRGDQAGARRLLQDSLTALSDSGNSSLEAQHLRSLVLIHLATGDIESARDIAKKAQKVCEEAGLEELAVDLISIEGSILLQTGDVSGALQLTRKAVDRLSPGVERAYLVHHRHALAATAAGVHEEARTAGVKADTMLRRALAGLRPEQLEHAIQTVPEHREIVAMAKRLTPTTIEVWLPLEGTPTGRPLQAEELCSVTWTVDHPDDAQIESPIERRQARLVRLIAEAEAGGTSPTTEQLARTLGVSASTVRRDLNALRDDGHTVSTRGGRRRVS